MKKASDWVNEEFKSICFGDRRINDRFLQVARTMSEQPENTICRAMEYWSEAKAAYRLFDNMRVTPFR